MELSGRRCGSERGVDLRGSKGQCLFLAIRGADSVAVAHRVGQSEQTLGLSIVFWTGHRSSR